MVMGTRGRTGLTRLLLGSVARTCCCTRSSVLIVRENR
ncbi:MAG: universal stress protein [Chloroflexota bacterium]